MRLSFYEHARQNYAGLERPDGGDFRFMVGAYSEDGGTSGEFVITLTRFRVAPDESGLVPRLLAYGDCYDVLLRFIVSGAWEEMCKLQTDDPDDFCRVLVANGIRDRSEFAERAVPCTECTGTGVRHVGGRRG